MNFLQFGHIAKREEKADIRTTTPSSPLPSRSLIKIGSETPRDEIGGGFFSGVGQGVGIGVGLLATAAVIAFVRGKQVA